MNAVWETLVPYVTPTSVKTLLYVATFLLMCVGFGRHCRIGTVPLTVALSVSLTLSLLAGLAVGETPAEEQWWLWGVNGAAALGALLMRWWRPAAWIEAVLLLLWLGGTIYREVPALMASWATAPLLQGQFLCRAFWALTLLLAVAYSLRLALRRPKGRAAAKDGNTAASPIGTAMPLWSEDPLPHDVTLQQLLPEETTMPSMEVAAADEVSPAATADAAAAKSATAEIRLPAGLKQTGVGAQLLLCKRRLDAGEISPAEYRRQKAQLIGLSELPSGSDGVLS